SAARKMHEEAENFRVMTMRVLQIQLRSLTAMDVVAYGGAAAGIGVAIWQLTHSGVTMFRTTFAPLDMFAG
ncbi:cysteine ABC transporter ATP-binding protein, partial [Erysipelatoclostridium ramosum]|nr:cysteine ABC transporter ATP-binding protein [Thomasclavelia ramosa]